MYDNMAILSSRKENEMIMEILKFIFQDFLHFMGMVILLGIILHPLTYLFGKRDI